MSKRGKYIVLEGIPGTRKTELAKQLGEELRARGVDVYLLAEPGGNNLVGRTIRTLTHDPRVDLHPKTAVLLYNAARVETLKLIERMLARGTWVIAERNWLSTLASQYYAGDGSLDYDEVAAICRFAAGQSEPDRTLILDLDPAKAERRAASSTNIQRFDNVKKAYLKKAREGFLQEAKKRDYPVVDAAQPAAKLLAALLGHLEPLLEGAA